MAEKEQKQENKLVNSTQEDKKQKTTTNAFGEVIIVNKINLTWGKVSFYLSLVPAMLLLFYVTGFMAVGGNNSVPASFTLFIFSVFAIPIITVLIITFTLIDIIGVKFKEIKDGNYLLRGFVLSVITLILYVLPWIPVIIYFFKNSFY